MKIYVLCDNPFDDGWNVYGLFSSEEKVNKAIEKFTPYSNHELHWASFELDNLEKFFEVSIPRIYSGYCPIYSPLTDENIKSVVWQSLDPSGLDTFLQEAPRKDSLLLTNALWLHVYARDKGEAIQKGNEMLKELIHQPPDERGWKWLEKDVK